MSSFLRTNGFGAAHCVRGTGECGFGGLGKSWYLCGDYEEVILVDRVSGGFVVGLRP